MSLRGSEAKEDKCLKIKNKNLSLRISKDLSNAMKTRTPSLSLSRRTAETSASAPGIITVEAALALSAFIIFFAGFLSIFGVLDNQIKIRYSAEQTAEELALAVPITETFGEDLSGIKELPLSYLGGYALLQNNLPADVSDEINGFVLLSDCFTDGDIILDIEYADKYLFVPKAFTNQLLRQRVVRHAWTGRSLTREDKENDGTDIYVYITDNASVYHTTKACSHLHLSIEKVSFSELPLHRNANGGKYYACERCCGEIIPDTVYITKNGVRYHSDINCGGLTRNIKRVKLSSILLPPCQRCGK